MNLVKFLGEQAIAQTEVKTKKLQAWIDGFITKDHNLFALNSDGSLQVREKIYGDRTIKLLSRTTEMDCLIQTEGHKLINSFKAHVQTWQGVIYFTYSIDMYPETTRVLNYIGISHKVGKNHNLNQNLKDLNAKDPKFFLRWGDDIARHIGGLSNALFHNGFPIEPKYQRWANLLFMDRAGEKVLKEPIYFCMQAWNVKSNYYLNQRQVALDELENKMIADFQPLVNSF
jgi:hypothetical protein